MKSAVLTLMLLAICIIPQKSFCTENAALENFIIKESLLKNDKIAVIAADERDKPIEINGTFEFSINGFKQELKFNDGAAVTSLPIEKSTFIYLKYINEEAPVSKLYYVIKQEDSLNPIKINLKLLVIIPLIIVVIISLFRKFLVYGIIILVALMFFNISKGLSIPTYLETVFEGLKSFF